MKRILALLAVAACAALTVITPAQTTPPTTITSLVSFKGGAVSQVISHRIGVAHEVFGLKLDIDIRGFGGLNLTNGNALTSGIILAPVKPFRISREINLTVGPYIARTGGSNGFDVGVFAGLTFAFGN